MKRFLLIISFISFYQATANATVQSYTGAQARELFKMIQRNPILITQVSIGLAADSSGEKGKYETYIFETAVSRMECTKYTTYSSPTNIVSFSCKVENP